MIEKITRYRCDNCNKVYSESKEKPFLPCGGPDNWVAFSITMKGTASKSYGSMSEKLFCCYHCAIESMQKEIKILEVKK